VLTDARSVPQGADLPCDLAIVGAGPAGIALADRLRGSGLRIVLLEAGGRHPDLATQRLYRGENVGHPYFPLDACRYRVLGGGSNRWGGWCRPLDAIDFEARDGAGATGWPIGAGDLAPYYADTATLFRLPAARFDVASWAHVLPAPLPLTGDAFENALFLYSPEVNFADAYLDRLRSAATVDVLLRANVTDVRLDPSGRRVAALAVRTLAGGAFTVTPRATVLAAGGIENARLLLASATQRAAGLGNEHDLVGRHFMEHLHVAAGHLLLAAPCDTAFYRKAAYPEGLRVRGVLTPTPQARRRHALLGASIAVEEPSFAYGTPFIGWRPEVTYGAVRGYRSLRHGPAGRAAERAKGTSERLWNVGRQVQTARAARRARGRAASAGDGAGVLRSLYLRTEQAPSSLSRVTLGDRRDALGLRVPRLDWRISDGDTASIAELLGHLDTELRAAGLGGVIAPADGWEDGIIGGPHHMGTTRMAADPRHGVVDADCAVHSVDGLYVAGSSVFATGGYANPTFTIVALALRLADHLRERLQPRA
jgi:choline dehydrogenase-like flavoprotein